MSQKPTLSPQVASGLFIAAGTPRAPGSVIGRTGSAPEGGPLTLSEKALYDGTYAKPMKSLPNAPKPTKGAKEPAA